MWSRVSLVAVPDTRNVLIAFAGALPPESFKLRYVFFIIALSFSFACIPPLLSWLTANLHGTGVATLAVPLNVSIGQIGQRRRVGLEMRGDGFRDR